VRATGQSSPYGFAMGWRIEVDGNIREREPLAIS
jgi:hypothetical protein